MHTSSKPANQPGAGPQSDDESLESQDDEGTESKEGDLKILEVAKKRFQLAAEAEQEQRKEELDDLNFLSGDQWPAEVKNQRALENRPTLTINRLPQFVQQIANEQRQNRQSIKVSPTDGEASEETAKIYQGLIRHIQYNSNADVAIDTAFEGAVGPGRGFFRLITDYCNPESFDQDILFKRIPNRFSVYMDPGFKEPDGSDMEWCFIFDDLSEDEYKEQFPNSELSGMQDWTSLGDRAPEWISGKHARVAEYFYKDYKDATLLLFKSGVTVIKEQTPAKTLEKLQKEDPIVRERKTKIPVIKWCKHNGIEILERRDLPGSGLWIPVIPVLGNEINIEGKRKFQGIIRHAKDPQRMYNYWTTAQTETIALAPKAPWVGYAGQFKGFEGQWRTANSKNHAYLEVNPVSINGQPAPLPQRNVYEPPIQAITASKAQSADDLKATTGVYDASLGNITQQEQSGVAIQRRNIQSQTSNFHFIDNLTRSIRHAGRICVDWIPYIYDGARTIRTIGEDDQEEIVKINQEFEKNGQLTKYEMDRGNYDVVVETGPSFATKRQEAVSAILDLIKAYPPAGQVIGDLLVRNMDMPASDEIAERLKKILPPGIADDPKEQQQPIPPQVQAQMKQMNDMIGQLSQHLHAAQDEIDQKKIETDQRKMEIESRERIALVNAETQLKIALMKTDSAEAIEAFRQEVDMIHKRLELLQVQAPIDDEIDADDQNAGAQVPTGGQSPGQSPADGQSAQSPTGGPSPGSFMGG